MIDEGQVKEAFLYCLYEDHEVVNGVPVLTPVEVEGINASVGFHPERLESHREQVREWLLLLPKTFQEGWSFLNACLQEDGRQWTDLHQRMDQLFMLASGLGMCRCFMPRSFWDELPGGMPYYIITPGRRPVTEQVSA